MWDTANQDLVGFVGSSCLGFLLLIVVAVSIFCQ